ncbi:MAG: MltA domain-containing protein [Paracoccaceae bacterium]
MAATLRALSELPGWADARRMPDGSNVADYFCGDKIAAEFTGYYEPVLPASRHGDARFRFPIHRLPDTGTPTAARAALVAGDALGGLELAWLDDPLEAFLLQVQGSGRLRFADGSMMRVGYAGSNGQAYVSIGKLLVARGIIPAHEIGIDAIRAHAAAHPEALAGLLNENPSYVFFKEIAGLPETAGPIGTAGIPLTAMQSVAVDPAHIPLGSLLWMEAGDPDPIRALVIAQDTGSAIKGVGRIDLFFGTGEAAGKRAGAFRCTGTVTPLIRRDGTKA